MKTLLSVLALTSIVLAGPGAMASRTGWFEPAVAPEYDSVAIAGYRFDPSTGAPEIADELRAQSDYCLVHLRGPVYEHMTAALESYGAKVIQYVPFNAFICRMNSIQRQAIQTLDFVNWVGNYEPAYKLSPLFSGTGRKTVLLALFYAEPVEPVLAALEASGGTVLEVSVNEWNKVIKADVDLARVPELARRPEVMWLEPWLEPVLSNESAQWVTQTWRQNIRRAWIRGVDGSSQVVNTTDTGILMGPVTHDMVRDPAVPVTTWGDFPAHRKVVAYQTWPGSAATFGDANSGSAAWHGTHTATTVCGADSAVGGTCASDGMAHAAKLYHMDIGTANGTLVLPGDLTNLYTMPYNGNGAGAARVSSHSWNYSTGPSTYAIQSAQTDQFMWNHKDFLVVFAAGNIGPNSSTVLPPGTAKDIVTAGACANGTSANQMASFSGRGPCNDTRYKPTVTAPGQQLRSGVGPNAAGYAYMSGTSMAAPCIAGNAALVRDYFARGFYPTGDSVPANRWTYISAALVKAVLINGASADMLGSTIPDNNTGWGRVSIDDALYFEHDARKLTVYDDTVGLSTGQFREYTVPVNNQAEPLKLTLVWTDYPGNAMANPAIVNNLDLQVTGPNSVQYRGNQYSAGQSTPNPSSWDSRNVEECVRRNVPEIGNWTIRVSATNVPQGTRQPFALVVSGGLGDAGTPTLGLSGSKLDDPPPGNGNARLDPGETVYITDTLRNLSAAAANGVAGKLRLRTPSPYITILDSTANFGDIPVGGAAHNGASRFRLQASPSTPPGTVVEFVLALSGTGFSQNIPFELKVGSSGFQVIWGPKPLPSFPSTGFNYGLTYNPVDQRLYITNNYSRKIYIYSSDSSVTYLGTIPAPDSLGTDIKYCAYDSTFWVAARPAAGGRKVYKMLPDGTVLWQFANPANDFPVGVGWVESEREMYLSDRRTSPNTFPQYVYVTDTLGQTRRRMDVPLRGNYGARCLAYEPSGPGSGSLLMLYTAFTTAGTQLDSVGVYEMRRSDLSIVQRILLPGWNARGIEYDPRDGNYWISIPSVPDRTIAKISGFYGPPTGIGEGAASPVQPELALFAPKPSVFRDRVQISYQLPTFTRARLTVCDLAGRVKAVLADGFSEPGTRTLSWDGRADDGSPLARGVYFCRLEANGCTATEKLVVQR